MRVRAHRVANWIQFEVDNGFLLARKAPSVGFGREIQPFVGYVRVVDDGQRLWFVLIDGDMSNFLSTMTARRNDQS